MVEAMLIAAGGERHQVTAAVLVFRAITWLLPLRIGALTYLAWRRQQARRRPRPHDAVPVAPVEPGSPPA